MKGLIMYKQKTLQPIQETYVSGNIKDAINELLKLPPIYLAYFIYYLDKKEQSLFLRRLETLTQ
jgi:hypothetical protein